MTRINDVAKTLTDWADSEGGLEAIARDYDGDLTGAVEALDADGHLLPDLPGPEFVQGKAWFDGIEIRPDGNATDYNYDLPLVVAPHELRNRAYTMLAAADYAERN